MSPLVKKEIRLLLPSWLAVLSLEIVLPWLWRDLDAPFGIIAVLFFLGMIILAVDAFGREFNLGTFSSQLSQPVERGQIWRTKITVLFIAAALIFAAYFASCELRLHQGIKMPVWYIYSTINKSDFHDAMFGSGVAMLFALVGGLWTVLLLRQIAAAFWITILAPAVISMLIVLITLCLPSKWANHNHDLILLYCAEGIYLVAGFWLAHRLFHRAQDVAWTGGVINFSSWRYFAADSGPSVGVRRHRPVVALFSKEFQLHSVSLFVVCALLALHIGVVFLRIFYARYHKNSFADGVSDCFWILWLAVPLVIGCTAVAEERKLGVAEEQLCLPVSRRAQFAIKFVPAMIFGVLLGGVMPIFLEMVAAHFAAPSEFFNPVNNANNFWLLISIVPLAAGLALVGFFASTLARNFLQALGIAVIIAIVIATGSCLIPSSITYLRVQSVSPFGFISLVLPILIAIPTVVVTYLWLVYRNFSRYDGTGRLWWRNLLGITGALLFIVVSSAAIYNRPWEIFEPAEPPHGPAKFSEANRPTLQNGYFDSPQVRLPDGRVWFDSLGYPFSLKNVSRWKQWWLILIRPLPESVGPRQFIAGSNWVSTTAFRVDWREPAGPTASKAVHITGYLDTVGIKRDGTLWIPKESKSKVWTGVEMIRFGDETNWLQTARHGDVIFLLKTDGTLWRWGTNSLDWNGLRTNWPTLRNSKPQQIGTNSDWKELTGYWPCYIRKLDGSVWSIYSPNTGEEEFERHTNLDRVVFQTSSRMNAPLMAYVGTNGTLWICNRHSNEYQNGWEGNGFLQVGRETNWLAVAVTWDSMVALRTNGSLWWWKFTQDSTAEITKTPPSRLGIHNDWVGLAGAWGGVVSLAADGSLWRWPGANYGEMTLLKPPKRPEFLGNIFDKAN